MGSDMSLMEDGAFTVAFDVDNKEHGILFVLHQDIADDEFALLQILSQTRYYLGPSNKRLFWGVGMPDIGY